MANPHDPKLNIQELDTAGWTEAATEAMSLDLPLDALLPEDVEVQTDRAEGRQRQISAKIQIPHSTEQVWQILTDYETLADFIPNLSKSKRIEHPQGGIRLEQVGTQCLMNFKFCARVVLDMVEQFPHQIEFQMIEGDFKSFSGSWQLEPMTLAGRSATALRYTLLVLPPRTMPIGLIERRLKQNLAANLVAIRQRAETLFG